LACTSPTPGSGYPYPPHLSRSEDTATTDIYALSLHDALPISSTPEGVQVAFLERSGQVAQSANIAAGTYTLSIRAAQRGNYQFSSQVHTPQLQARRVRVCRPPNANYNT